MISEYFEQKILRWSEIRPNIRQRYFAGFS